MFSYTIPVSYVLLNTYNFSLQNSNFLTHKKCHYQFMKPIPVSSNVSDFRPTSILSYLSKKNSSLQKKVVLNSFQPGLRSQYSIQYALLPKMTRI